MIYSTKIYIYIIYEKRKFEYVPFLTGLIKRLDSLEDVLTLQTALIFVEITLKRVSCVFKCMLLLVSAKC